MACGSAAALFTAGTPAVAAVIALRGHLRVLTGKIAFDLPRSRSESNHYNGRLFNVSMLNLHDNWINWADV